MTITARHLATARKMAAAVDHPLTLQGWIDIETQTLDREEALLVEAERRQVWAEVLSLPAHSAAL